MATFRRTRSTRMTAFGLVVSTLLACAACGTEAPEPPALDDGSGVTAADLTEAIVVVDAIDDPWLRALQLDAWTGDLNGMIERRFLRVLTPVNRTHYFVDGGRERGIVAEMADALEDMLNKRAGVRDLRVVVIPVRRDQLLPMLIRGVGDVAVGNLTVTPERLEKVDFSPPFVSEARELVVTAPGVPLVEQLDDLSGREVWVRRSSSYDASLRALDAELEEKSLPPVQIRAADEHLEDEGLLEMVDAGLYPATVVDSHKLEWLWKKVFVRLAISDVAIRDKGEIAAAIRKGSPELRALLADFFEQHRVGTGFGNILVRRYFSESRWVRNVGASQERRKFDAVVDLFRKYADQYEFDYLMMIAQGYQESRLDPAATSPVGALGIMQLMPSTSSGPPIFMDDVSSPDRNIHAGIKYMRHIVDQYFPDPELDEVNRHLLAFAAYNAGPNRVARLRRLAPEYGFDPNKWFRNVEYVVASKVGQEPVRYVGKIYKYYLAYRRIRQLEAQRSAVEPSGH